VIQNTQVKFLNSSKLRQSNYLNWGYEASLAQFGWQQFVQLVPLSLVAHLGKLRELAVL